MSRFSHRAAMPEQRRPLSAQGRNRQHRPDVLWYSRCPVPTPLGLAARLGWLEQEFSPDAIAVLALQDEPDPLLRRSHYDHHLYGSFRQGGNVPALWAKASGADTLLLGLNWLDEAQLLLVRPSSELQTLSQLAHARLALPVTDSPVAHSRAGALRAYHICLQQGGVPADTVQLVEVPGIGNAYSEQITALLQGYVDVIFVKGARGLQLAQQLKLNVLFDLRRLPDPVQRANNGAPRPLTVDATLWREHPQLVLRVLNRVLDVEDWAASHAEATRHYLADESGCSTDTVLQAYGADVHLRMGISLAFNQLDALDQYKNFLVSQRLLPANFELSDWIEPLPLQILQSERAKKRSQVAATPGYSAAIASLW